MPATPPPEHRRFVEDLLQLALKHGATELLMTVGAPPMMRLQARLVPLSKQPFTDAHVRSLADLVLQGQAWDEAQLRRGLHRTWHQPEGSRWRAEVQSHRGEPALWLCLLPETVPALDELNAPEEAATAALSAHGLLFMASRLPTLLCTAVAALAEHRHRHGHGRVALLDPDFPYEGAAFVDARAGLPDDGVSQALASRLRGLAATGAGQAGALLLPPDADDATLTAAIEAAPRMLCIVPLTRADRAGGWPAWLRERTDAMPGPARAAWLTGVAATFAGALRLCPVPRLDGRGDARAWVRITPQPMVSETIARGEFDELAEFERGPSPRSGKSMTALDDALFEMHERGEISWEDALRRADSVNALRLAIKLRSKTCVGALSAGTDILFMDGPPTVPRAAVPEPVQLRAFVPQAIAQGGSGVVDLWACLPDQTEQVARLAASSRQTLQAGLRAGLPVARGALLCITLQIDGLEVTEPTQVLPWIGEPGNVGFLVHASAEARVGQHVARAQLDVAGASLGSLHFMLTVAPADRARDLDLRLRDAQGETRRPRTAFASYASEDRAQMLARVQGMQAVAPDLDIFVDALSLRSGEHWQQRIAGELGTREALFLFWSAHAARSPWVRYEWQHMLGCRGLQAIQPVPLADPRDAVPPPELASLHFGSAYLGWLLAERARQDAGQAI